jgi:hypothetical protein
MISSPIVCIAKASTCDAMVRFGSMLLKKGLVIFGVL